MKDDKTSTSIASAPSKSGSTLKMSAHIKVVVRVRPPNERELNTNHRSVVEVVDDRMLVFDPQEQVGAFFYQGVQQPNKNYLKRANKELKFAFDRVFSQKATNRDVFETTAKEILASLMEGYNCSIFAYGATGAGKTFTMIGNEQCPGITYLTMEHLFYSIASFENEREFDIGVSYIEIYNENVFDLLKPSKTPLQLREDSKYGVMVAGLTLHKIKTARELLNMLESGNKNRTQHPTDANAESSRSHAVFQVYVKMRCKTSSQYRVVKLSTIDLAGSERASATGCVGDRFKEGANINRSLLSLGNCINKLADGGGYIPYRDSKLTRLLKDSLGGNCKTIMIANVSPSSASYDDTYNTLKYAARANKIQLSIKQNIVDGPVRAAQYVKINEELKKKVRELEAKLVLSSNPMDSKKQDLAKENEKQKWLTVLNEKEKVRETLELQLLGMMTRQRVLALRHQLRTHAPSHVVDLAHTSSSEATEQMCKEDIPHQELAADHYIKQLVALDSKVLSNWTKWDEINKKMQTLLDEALAACPGIAVYIENIRTKSELRRLRASDNMRQKLLLVQKEEINSFAECFSEMPKLLKKMYLILKGYNEATPSLTDEYLEIMKNTKSTKRKTLLDKDTDMTFVDLCTLDLEQAAKPIIDTKMYNDILSSDIVIGSDVLTDIENCAPTLSGVKRKTTPVKLVNNDTIVIDDSLELLDTTETLNSAKKIKREFESSENVENTCFGPIDVKKLNSTFVLAGMKGLKKQNNLDTIEERNRGLADRTNTIPTNFNDRAKIVKPVVGRAIPFRRPLPPATQAPTVSGFGSSVARDGTPLMRNVQAVRSRARVPPHPYSRPKAAPKK